MKADKKSSMSGIPTAILLLFLFSTAVILTDYIHAIVSGVLLISLLILRKLNRLHPVIPILFAGMALLYSGGSFYRLYDTVEYYDKVLHIYAAFVVTYTIGRAAQPELTAFIRSHASIYFITLFVFGLTIGLLWELFEWVMGMLTGQMLMKGTVDTITDIIADAAGIIIAAALLTVRLKK